MPKELSNLPEFADLCHELRDQTISEEDFARLEQMILSDEAARKYYHQYMTLHSGLHQIAQLQSLSAGERVMPHTRGPKSVAANPHLWLRISLAVAASGLIAIVLYAFWSRPSNSSMLASASTATIIAQHQSQWGGTTRENAGTLPPGIHTLKSGVVKLRLRCDAEVTVQSPSTFELFDDKRLGLNHGRVVVFAPKSAHGFRVETEAATVVDLGTRFGVTIANDQFSAHVFDGKVQALMKGVSGSFDLVGGQGIAADTKLTEIQELKADETHFVTHWPAQSSLPVTRGEVEFLLVPPKSLRPHNSDLAGKRKLGVFLEHANVILESPVQVTFTQPGKQTDLAETREWIEAGQAVDSFFAHIESPDPARVTGGEFVINGSLTFARPIVGVSARHFEGLTVFENRATEYRPRDSGGLEGVRSNGMARDSFMLSPDRKTLTFHLVTSTRDEDVHDWVDQFRVFVESENN